jgi:hypothetical protein
VSAFLRYYEHQLIITQQRVIADGPFQLYIPGGGKYDYTPSFHVSHDSLVRYLLFLIDTIQWPDELKFFSEIHNAVERCYVDGKPKWMSRPEDSAFCIISKHEMDCKSGKEIQEILKYRHIYVIDESPPMSQFNEDALGSLGQFDKSIVMHGMMVSPPHNIHFYDGLVDFSKPNMHDSSSQHVHSTLKDLLDSHNAGDTGTILNGLDFPMPWLGQYSTSFATDVLAFNSTVDMPLCKRSIMYPSSSLKWGLAATAGAHHLWHIDCNGFGTVINTQTGFKWWIIGHPLPGHDFSKPSEYLNNCHINIPNNDKWQLEAILLAPGSRL